MHIANSTDATETSIWKGGMGGFEGYSVCGSDSLAASVLTENLIDVCPFTAAEPENAARPP